MADSPRRTPLRTLFALLAFAPVATATSHTIAQNTAERADEAAEGAKAAGTPAGRPQSASDYPRGAALVGEDGAVIPVEARASSRAPRIRIRVDPRRTSPSPPSPLRGPASLSDLPAPPLAPEGAADAVEGGTIGPGPTEQLGVFDAPPGTSGREVRESSRWTPTPAYGEIVPGQAYPWQPASWGRKAIDPSWTPDPAWPRRDEEASYPWNPVRWNTSGSGTTWRPEDAWGRGRGE